MVVKEAVESALAHHSEGEQVRIKQKNNVALASYNFEGGLICMRRNMHPSELMITAPKYSDPKSLKQFRQA